MSHRTAPGEAPNATRTPISVVRRSTLYDVTPYRPNAARSTPNTANVTDNVEDAAAFEKRRLALEMGHPDEAEPETVTGAVIPLKPPADGLVWESNMK